MPGLALPPSPRFHPSMRNALPLCAPVIHALCVEEDQAGPIYS